MATPPAAKFDRPGFFTKHVFNRAVTLAARLGISMAGSRTLIVAGRRSGEPRTTPVNPLEIDGRTYLVAPRGTTEWVRNLRAAGEGELTLGRRSRRFRGEEIGDEEKLPILKAYLDKWAWEVGAFFHLPKDPNDDQIREVAPAHPVFRVSFSERGPRAYPVVGQSPPGAGGFRFGAAAPGTPVPWRSS